MEYLESRLEELRDAGLLRGLRRVTERDGPRLVLDGRRVTLLCSNDYLGLADDPRVAEAAAEAARRWGAGAGASRLVSGNLGLHAELEEALADFKGYERCILFGSGYLANTAIVAALAGRGQTVLSDELNHASIVDGCRLARAETIVYRHADLDHLEQGLRRAARRSARAGGAGPLIVTDGVFSMDGDVAPLEGIVALARRYGARVMVDEAHATGAIGPGGRGSLAAAGLGGQVDMVVGTLGKALGSYGAYACCDAATAEWLVNTARGLIFSTALPPPAVGAAEKALELVRREPERIVRLGGNADVLRRALADEGLAVGGEGTQIVPVVVGEAHATLRACEAALEGGVFAQAIRPPTVPPGTSRLRLSAMATHAHDELRGAARVVGAAVRAALTADRAETGSAREASPEDAAERAGEGRAQFAEAA